MGGRWSYNVCRQPIIDSSTQLSFSYNIHHTDRLHTPPQGDATQLIDPTQSYPLTSPLPSTQIQRTGAGKRIHLRILKRINQPLTSGISTQPGHRKRTAQIDNIPNIDIPPTSHETPRNPRNPAVMLGDIAGIGIKPFAVTEGVFLDVEREGEPGREGVCELDDAEGGDDGDEAEEVGDGGGDDEGDGPVDGDDDGPEDFAFAGGEERGVEEVHEDVVVEDFDADVAVQACGDETGGDGEHVADDLPAVGGDALVGELVGVLALEVVDVAAVDEVDGEDEELGAPHGLDEVAGAFHFGHEFDEELGAAVGVDALHEAVDGAEEAVGVGEPAVVDDGGVFSRHGVGGDGYVVGRCASGAED